MGLGAIRVRVIGIRSGEAQEPGGRRARESASLTCALAPSGRRSRIRTHEARPCPGGTLAHRLTGEHSPSVSTGSRRSEAKDHVRVGSSREQRGSRRRELPSSVRSVRPRLRPRDRDLRLPRRRAPVRASPRRDETNPGLRPRSVGSEGGLWVGTNRGLDLVQGGAIRHQPIGSDLVWTMLTGRDGSIWIGTEGGGIWRSKDGKYRQFTTRDGLPGNEVRTVLEEQGRQPLGRHQLRPGSFHTGPLVPLGDRRRPVDQSRSVPLRRCRR